MHTSLCVFLYTLHSSEQYARPMFLIMLVDGRGLATVRIKPYQLWIQFHSLSAAIRQMATSGSISEGYCCFRQDNQRKILPQNLCDEFPFHWQKKSVDGFSSVAKRNQPPQYVNRGKRYQTLCVCVCVWISVNIHRAINNCLVLYNCRRMHTDAANVVHNFSMITCLIVHIN